MRLRVCPTCDELHTQGQPCPQRKQRPRPTREARGYNWAWRKLAHRVINEERACRVCGHTGSPNNPLTGDHIIPLSRGGARLDRDNAQCLCRNHNSAKRNRAGGYP